MVKLTGPGLAQQAAGSIAGDVTFSKWKGKSYLKKHRRPKQPRTAPQKAMRAIMAFLSGEWAQISAADQASWVELAATAEISPFNAYQRENLTRWRSFLYPSEAYPPTEIGNWGGIAERAATGMPRAIRISIRNTSVLDLWGVSYSTVAGNLVVPTWEDLISIQPMHSIGWHHRVVRDFQPGTYWIAFGRFNVNGRTPPAYYYRQATVTN